MELKKIANFYRSKRVLVTGGTGLKGAWLIELLKFLGAETFNLSLSDISHNSAYNAFGHTDKITNYFIDIRHKKEVSRVIENLKPDIIFHLAAQTLVLSSYDDPFTTIDTNLMGTLNLYEAVRKYSEKSTIICATTDKVYRNTNTGHSFSEEDELGFSDPYSTSKAMVELLSGSFFNLCNKENNHLKIATVRAGNIIGPGDWSQNRLLPDIATSIFSKKKFILRNPQHTRPWQFVMEPLIGYLKLPIYIDSNNQDFVAMNFGPQKNHAITTLEVAKLAQAHSDFEIHFNEENTDLEQKLLSLDSTKSKKILGHSTNLDPQQRVWLTLDGYQEIIENQTLENTFHNFLKIQKWA